MLRSGLRSVLRRPAARAVRWSLATSSAQYDKVHLPFSATSYDSLDTFARRHFGPTPAAASHMLATLGYSDMDDFLARAVPPHVLTKRPLKVAPLKGYTEQEMLAHLNDLAGRNHIARSFIGKGYYGTIVPPVIQRNLLELPEWYTLYTPYQPEISQGRLELLLNYQTMVTSLTGLDVANASLLDEGTAAAEAMAMAFHHARGKKPLFVVDCRVHAHTVDVMQLRALHLGVELVRLDLATPEGLEQLKAAKACGALVQYPATDGSLSRFDGVADAVHGEKGLFAVATDLLALTLLRLPRELGADIALGSLQRFGVPFGYGGPHAAFFATTSNLARKMPGRLVGRAKDRLNQPALRLALQTREQHIKRERATSNICTAQALLANMAAMYAVYHGPEGLRRIARRVYGMTAALAQSVRAGPHTVVNSLHFDTLTVRLSGDTAAAFALRAFQLHNINVFVESNDTVSVALDETALKDEVAQLAQLFGGSPLAAELPQLPREWARSDDILPHPVFNAHHSETAMLRYLHKLQSRDLSLANLMIPLGLCTMKLNATVEMQLLLLPGFAQIHPFAPADQAKGYQALVAEFERDLNDITGFAATTLMPNSGAQGEYTGLLLIRSYHEAQGQNRTVCLIPVSAHGTNPALAAMAGLRVVAVKCTDDGLVDLADLRAKAEKHKDDLCAAMFTYPSTYGLFEPGVRDAIDIVHANGGLVYLDGANMNAQVGLTSPGDLGADVCHLNIHKTFALSHGGGGPGQGPVCVADKLVPFLPKHRFANTPHSTATSIQAVNLAPFGSAAVLPVSYAYIKMLGAHGLPFALALAMLNANYMLHRLKEHFPVMFINGTSLPHCAHEFIIDIRPFKNIGIEAIDVAKRLQDYGFHAPTMSFPVAGTLMIEPTELENLEELDRFVESMISIRAEIDAYSRKEPLGNVLKNAPHPLHDVVATPQLEWDARGYTREQAAYPLPHLRDAKCWPTVGRLDDAYGDMNLLCTCPSVEELAE